MMLKVAELKGKLQLNNAEIEKLKAEAEKLSAQADSEPVKTQIAAIDAQIGARKSHNDTILQAADMMLKGGKARNDIEQGHHKMLMDVQDRILEKESSARENLAAGQSGAGQTTPSTTPGA